MSIKETLDKLDEKFLTNPKSRMCYLSGDEKRELVKFVEEEIKKAMEEIVPKTNEGQVGMPITYFMGYNYAIQKINSNISKYFKV